MTDTPARKLAAAIGPFAAQVYFAPECHQGYADLGFAGSPGKVGSVEMFDKTAYFCSRGSTLGQVSGEVIAATFAVYNPAVVIPAVTHGWTLTDAKMISKVRTDGAVKHLRRILGASPKGIDRAVELLKKATSPLPLTGRPLFAGLVSLKLSGDPLTDAWRLADELREFRGETFINTWIARGIDAVEIGLLDELKQGGSKDNCAQTKGWTDQQLTVAEERLRSRGWISNNAATDAGRAVLEELENATDERCSPAISGLGGEFDEFVDLIGGWSKQIQAAGGCV